MIDMTSRPPMSTPEGKMIDHTTDHGAHKTSRGDWELVRQEDYMK